MHLFPNLNVGMALKNIVQVIIEKEEQYYTGRFVDLPIVTQAPSLDELVRNLQEAFDLYIEDENLEEHNMVASPSIIAHLELFHA